MCKASQICLITMVLIIPYCLHDLAGEARRTSVTTQGTLSDTHRVVRGFVLRDKSMEEAVIQLRREAGIPVCFERVRLDPATDRYRNSSGRWVWREARFSLSLSGASLGQVLDQLVQRDPAYVYSFDQITGTLRVFPRSGSILNWKVGPIDVENMPLCELLFGPADRLGLLRHGVRFVVGSGFGVQSNVQVPITVRVPESNVADCLNYICSVARLPVPGALPSLAGVHYRACYELIPTPRSPYATLRILGCGPREVDRGSSPASVSQEFVTPPSSMTAPTAPPGTSGN
jgi:hypothetical protein